MKMNYKKIFAGLMLSCALLVSCDDQDYVDINKDPDGLTAIPPESQFLKATVSIHSQDYEAFYDFYRRMMPWMQYVTPTLGNGEDFTSNFGNFYRYDRLYIGVGDVLTDMDSLVGKLPEKDQPRYNQMKHIGHILKAYYAFYVTDIFGSIVYSQGFQARYGGTLLPAYDNQQTLLPLLDSEIEAAVAGLKEAQELPQIPLGSFDQYYNGDINAWMKAGNALRLRIATRLVKRDRNKATEIANEVLADASNLMIGNADGWVLKTAAKFTDGGNYNPDGLRASKPLVDFLLANDDPRLDAFVEPNDYSQANIDFMIANGKLNAGTTAQNRYVGSFTSPDEVADDDLYNQFYTPVQFTVGDASYNYDTLSLIQRRLFQPSFNNGTGVNYIPVLTYADFCFNRAELAELGVTTEDAKTYYDKGVVASIEWYNEAAIAAKLQNYTVLGGTEITNYLAQPAIAFDETKALEQIAAQVYLNSFRQPSEGWAVWKRTGYPSAASTVLPLTDMKTNNVSLRIPRRAPLSPPLESAPNYDNIKKAYDEMAADPNFGQSTMDAFGRVWWDAL
ncbi:SusD/RagB family nutrient-binding outer membrane lipoprotein [Dawidia soli]|uniref:SusD/RagB family nutrient-binding outer membrane lipoprotein n=1 Tax=Dawidia soli TaxID=2782352 RepID=A0AAP2GEH5_9BACT|nr:SusD/RagB family nutrient-binding outer membrane lipoprotein [Dawidia soli]MBT1688387.1 SusD/RagB family nutrient-binding outer membrane lipoprotein [Dawidia soli]